MKKTRPLLFSLATGILLWASWPVSPFAFLIFIAFLPFLWLAHTEKNRIAFFACSYLSMLIWNLGTTWWICNSTVPGGVAAILANSLLMCIPLLGFYNVRRKFGETRGYIALVVFWLTFEYIHLNWQLSWPWLTLGNMFASHPNWVQWYQFTGTSGGTLWILVTNICLFVLLRKLILHRSTYKARYSIPFVLTLALPFTISYSLIPGIEKPGRQRPGNFVVIQPNIDPYEKFQVGSQEVQLQLLIRLSETKIDSNTSIVVWPETALSHEPDKIDMEYLREDRFLDPVWNFLKSHPNIKLFTGIEGIRFFTRQTKTPHSRSTLNPDYFYESYNAAALLDTNGALQVYNKSKLVPGVETLPSFLNFLGDWFEKFGGTTGGYAPQEERTVLEDPRSGYKIVPAICYESIYGEFLTQYIKKGANVIVIITNDGWWANTSGHKQHMQYARLRAIETRRWVKRASSPKGGYRLRAKIKAVEFFSTSSFADKIVKKWIVSRKGAKAQWIL